MIGSVVPANPVYPTSSGSTAPMTFPIPNSWMFSLLIDVSPSVIWMLYVPSGDISFRIFSSPARMFWAYEFVSVPIVIWIVFVYRTFPVFRIISSSPSIRNSTSGFSLIVSARLTWASW